ncbi:MAG TPA: DNA translocase FtsK [Gemmatimonadaceae bacterium]|nr:DNA translocase FtsK [Gemmatimonadaceae bacterium]
MKEAPAAVEQRHGVLGGVFVLLALYLGASVAVGPGVPGAASCLSAHAAMGPVGSCFRAGSVWLLGLPATVLIPIALGAHGLRLYGLTKQDTDRKWLWFLIGLMVLVPIGVGLAAPAAPGARSQWSGLWGGFASYYMDAWFSRGAWIWLAIFFLLLTGLTLAYDPLRALLASAARPRAAVTGHPNGKKAGASALEPSPGEIAGPDDAEVPDARRAKKKGKTKGELTAEQDERVAAAIDAHVPLASDRLPPTTLLSSAPQKDLAGLEAQLLATGDRLIQTLRTFKVEAKLGKHQTGPVVTQFEVEPASGVKVRQIANLANDLALAMKAQSIRIVAPIPGRGAVGIEIPNPEAEIVGLRELLESPEFKNARGALPIILGRDLEGKPVVADLAKMPHLLIAGATGSGKSICVNTLITSLVYKHTPRTLRFLMVDPKMVELSVYKDLPHLRSKVITDNRQAASVLKWAQMEMQQRYELCAENGARNIQEFNNRVRGGAALRWPKQADVAFEAREYTQGELPYVVVVIDELADLMMTVQGEIETPLAILAQKARAIGIHLILATQRPSVNVITGLIKANFPSRIAFRVASQVDSRTIIDGMGAESLLGNGDMLFIPPGKSEPARLQGAFISSEDTEKLLKWYKEEKAKREQEATAKGLLPEEPKAEPDILEEVRKREAEEAAGEGGEIGEPGERDKLFREAAEACIQNQGGSTSLLQRRLKIGYGRAARLIDQLQEAGILGPPDGSKPRDVLVGFEELERIAKGGGGSA